ncbi:MAG: hypothetical protein QXJ13_07380 [Candidatus Bathyarchaeia archaeon]
MKYKVLMPLFMLLSAFLLTSGICVSTVDATEEEPSFAESISVTVNCTTAELTIFSTVHSIDASLVHFPSEVNLNRGELIDATSITVAFSRDGSSLLIAFNNTDAATARTLADAVKGSIENAFNAGFIWNTTKIESSYVYVEYIGPGKRDLTEYTSWLMERCLAPDLKGFTLTFLPISSEENAFVGVNAAKESGGFNWIYFMTVGYSTSAPVGMGPHKIDILDLLNVESLTPSSYASYEGWFISTVQFVVVSNGTVSFLSSEPGLMSPPTQLKGWLTNIPPQPPAQLIAQFSFADDPTPVDRLSITFSGLIIPEFTAPTQLILLILAISVTLAARKRLRVSFK